LLKHDEKLEWLSDETSIIVSKAHRFGTDAILLADFACIKKNDLACDLGTGCGIIPMLWCGKNKGKTVYGVEIQEDAAKMAARSVLHNRLDERVVILNSDLKELKGKLPHAKFDLVTCNPPYKAPGAGIVSAEDSDKIARHETMCTLDDIVKASNFLLKSGGRLCMCMRPERLTSVIMSMKENKIEPKRLRLVSQRNNTAPWLFLIEGKKDAKPNISVLPHLFIENSKGNFTKDMIEIYGEYKNRYLQLKVGRKARKAHFL